MLSGGARRHVWSSAVASVATAGLGELTGSGCDVAVRVQRRMAERVTSSNVRWESVSKVWASQPFYRAVKPAAAETLFVRHVAKLQQEEAQYDRICAAEVRRHRVGLPGGALCFHRPRGVTGCTPQDTGDGGRQGRGPESDPSS